MAVISNKAEHLVKIILKTLKADQYFERMYGGDSFKEKKPSSLPLIETMKELKVSPNEVLMVGDSDNDVVSASKAGAKTCFCTYGFQPKLKISTSDYTVDSAESLLKLLKGL